MPASPITAFSNFRQLNLRLVCYWLSSSVLVAVLAADLFADEDSSPEAASAAASTGDTPSEVNNSSTQSANADLYDPFEHKPAKFDPFDLAAPIAAIEQSAKPRASAPPNRMVFLQAPANGTEDAEAMSDGVDVTAEPLPAPCEGASEKPMYDLGINIVLPSGLLPKDHAGDCWAHLNAVDGSVAAMRCWPMLSYYWDATCLCHRPLYFEETNLERYGYGCCCQCLQPAVSAAHFFGTVPALPYCMAAHCPCECEYTLGHYRPGSCPPRRCNWPSCKPIAAAAEAGVMTGFVFLIP
jgi:hypothetical protein